MLIYKCLNGNRAVLGIHMTKFPKCHIKVFGKERSVNGVIDFTEIKYRGNWEKGSNRGNRSKGKIVKGWLKGSVMFLIGETRIADTHISLAVFGITESTEILVFKSKKTCFLPFDSYYTWSIRLVHIVGSDVS